MSNCAVTVAMTIGQKLVLLMPVAEKQAMAAKVNPTINGGLRPIRLAVSCTTMQADTPAMAIRMKLICEFVVSRVAPEDGKRELIRSFQFRFMWDTCVCETLSQEHSDYFQSVTYQMGHLNGKVRITRVFQVF